MYGLSLILNNNKFKMIFHQGNILDEYLATRRIYIVHKQLRNELFKSQSA